LQEGPGRKVTVERHRKNNERKEEREKEEKEVKEKEQKIQPDENIEAVRGGWR
jgi:hypothetical protein